MIIKPSYLVELMLDNKNEMFLKIPYFLARGSARLGSRNSGQYSGNTQFFGYMSIWEHIQRSHKYFIQQQIKIQILWHTISWHTIISKYTFWIYKYFIIQYFNIHYEYLDIQTFQNTIFRHSCYYVIIHTYIKSTHYFKDSKTSSNLT